MNKINYQKKTEEIIGSFNGERKALLLHSCCAPCSSYCIEYLSRYFDITVFYYNPNLYPDEEFKMRVDEQKRFIEEFNKREKESADEQKRLVEGFNKKGKEFTDEQRRFVEGFNNNGEESADVQKCFMEDFKKRGEATGETFAEVKIIEGDFEKELFYDNVKGLEKEPEGGARCEVCFKLRLSRTAEVAEENGFDYFATTLTISPLKNAEMINEIGQGIARDYNAKYLSTDFKKKNGYKRSIELSREYSLYRQDYCGCIYSIRE